MSWATEEFSDIDLGDKRLDKRLHKLAETLARQPSASIPSACKGWDEIQSAYRFFAKDRISWEDILKPHWSSSVARMAQHPVALCIQDTTELNFNGQEIRGLGRLCYEAQRGMYLHPTLAITPDREPLGVVDAYMWARAEKGQPDIVESTRLIEGYERVAKMAEQLPNTRLVYMADREADILELMQKAAKLNHPADWLIRAKHNRALPPEPGQSKGKKLWASIIADEPLGEIEFVQAARRGQKRRTVRQRVWAKRMTLDKGVQATCVIAQEIAAPAGVTSLTWRLLTNREAVSVEDVRELIDWYRARWEIELFFHVIKNGCRIEALQLGTIKRLERAIALYLVVSWRIARLMRLGRTCPDLPADMYFEPDEWKSAYILRDKPVPKRTPKLNEVIRTIASLGGFIGRKGDGEPGVKALWLGMQRVFGMAKGMRHIREIGGIEEA